VLLLLLVVALLQLSRPHNEGRAPRLRAASLPSLLLTAAVTASGGAGGLTDGVCCSLLCTASGGGNADQVLILRFSSRLVADTTNRGSCVSLAEEL
jgi:hypothetical protein